jgi:hypothetical protein
VRKRRDAPGSDRGEGRRLQFAKLAKPMPKIARDYPLNWFEIILPNK